MEKNTNVVLGVTGGIAIYKSLDLVSKLIKESYNVDVIMTKSAMEFVRPLTFQSISNNKVYHEMFNETPDYDIEHISLAKKADILVIAPATANIIGKVASGIGDDLLTTTIMATKAKVLFVPAMNTNMYENPIVKDNIEKLKSFGYEFMEPSEGRLACGDVGKGKMPDVLDILEVIKKNLTIKDFTGRKILVTAGPTIEKIDPVRFITNHSSGKMGYEIARAASYRGADVTLISGPNTLKKPVDVKVINVESASEMLEKVKIHFKSSEGLIMTAAVSDYRPSEIKESKIKKNDDSWSLELSKNPDILSQVSEEKSGRWIVGFAMETEDLEVNASKKMERKNLDMIVANSLRNQDAGFKKDTNQVSIITKDGIEKTPVMSKFEIANIILDKLKSSKLT